MNKQGKNTTKLWAFKQGMIYEERSGSNPIANESDVGIARMDRNEIRTSPTERDSNARLIVAARNACMKVNPSNPIAAAEALPELLDACILVVKTANSAAETGHSEAKCVGTNWDVLGSILRAAIANAKRGE